MSRSQLATLLLILSLAGCEAFHSDSENFARQRKKEQEERVAGMRSATATTEKGKLMEGEALRRLVSGKTHSFIYQTTPTGKRERYVEKLYFEPNGHLVYRNNQWALSADGKKEDYWKASGERFCVLLQDMGRDEQCFTLALLANGRVQYYIHRPGNETHGLLTKVTDRVDDGLPAGK